MNELERNIHKDLNRHNIAISEDRNERVYVLMVAEYLDKKDGGLRLTDDGYDFCVEKLDLQFYEIPFPKDLKNDISKQ